MTNLRIATYNVHFGKNTEAIASAFLENKNLSKADVILFQEIEFHELEAAGRAESVAKSLGFYFHYTPARPLRLRKGTHGLAILSRFPLSHYATIQLPRYHMVVNSRQRIAVVSRIVVNGKKITLCNIHLDARLNAKERLQQLRYALHNLPPGPVIVGGDFNTIPMFLAARLVPVFYTNQYKKVHEEMLLAGFRYYTEIKSYTMRKILRMKLDHIYSDAWPITACGVETSVRASDHFPVWADIKLSEINEQD